MEASTESKKVGFSYQIHKEQLSKTPIGIQYEPNPWRDPRANHEFDEEQ